MRRLAKVFLKVMTRPTVRRHLLEKSKATNESDLLLRLDGLIRKDGHPITLERLLSNADSLLSVIGSPSLNASTRAPITASTGVKMMFVIKIDRYIHLPTI